MSRRTAAIATACAGGFLAFLDTTIVNTAFPDIAASFSAASPAELSWILDAYFIVMAALLVPAGAVADRVGRKRVFLAGLAVFVPASLLCALAPGWEVLVAGRALQGAGAAVIVGVSLALVLPEYPPERRASAVAVWGATAALAAAVGPALGGLLVELGDWRWVFAANLPLGALVYAGARALEESKDETAQGLPDLLGIALVIGGLGLLALGILEGGEWGWTSARILAPFAVAAVLLSIAYERCRRHPRPVIDPELLRNQANLATLLLGMAFFSTILANIVFLTVVWDYSVLTAGLAVVPGAVATTLVAVPAGRLADRYGHRAAIVPGCLLYVLGMAVVRGAGDEPDFLGTWLPAMALNGAGLGLSLPTLAAWALQDVAPERLASASAVQAAFRQFGGVLGTAALFAAGVPVTLAAAEDAYLVSTVWALGAGIVAASRSPLPLGAVVVTGVLVFAAPAAAAATTTTITTPASPAYRLYEPMLKAAPPMAVSGASDGTAGDHVQLACGATPIVRVPVGQDGSFRADVPLKAFPRTVCTLRGLPDKFGGKDFDAFRGPVVSVTYFNATEYVTAVRDEEAPVPYDYLAGTAHLRGFAELHSAAGGALSRDLWTGVARLREPGKGDRSPVEVDGVPAFAAANIPRSGDRQVAPAGFEGVLATLQFDDRTGAVVVRELQKIVRCSDEACAAVEPTGVRLERTIAFTHAHAVAEVQDRWLSTDGQPHRLRLVYTHGTNQAETPLWRLPGSPEFASRDYPDAFAPDGPGALLLHDGAAFGALRFDPAPSSFVFGDPRTVEEVRHATTPLLVRQAFEVGDQVIATEPPPEPEPEIVPVPDKGPPPHVLEDRQAQRTCTVPRVRSGATVRKARAALKKAGCKTARRTRKTRSTKVRKGRVVALSRKAGSRVPVGTAITIKVSRGR